MERESVILKYGASNYEAFVVGFLRGAIQEEAHLIKPPNLSEDRWMRQRNIGGVYNGSPATYQDLADIYGLHSKERMRQINFTFLSNLWNNCSLEIQERYPLDVLLTVRKPWSQRSKEKKSASNGGTSLRIKEQIELGVKDIKEISRNTGISIVRIRNARPTLKGWGIDISIERSSHKEVYQQLEEETDDGKIQELLDQLSYHGIRHDMAKRKKASQFLSLTNLIRDTGFHLRNSDAHFFATSLKTAGVPISRKDMVADGTRQQIFTYYIILLRHRDRVLQVLKEDQDLQRFLINPVTLVYGKGDRQFPTTTKLVRKDGYETVGKIFKELGVRIGGGSKLKYSDVLTPDCPASIYKIHNRGTCYYPVTQEEALRLFIAEKLTLS